MKYLITLTDSALKDLEEIKRFIAYDNVEKANQYISEIFNRLKLLKDFPELGKKISNALFDYVDCLVLPTLNHLAIYQINRTVNIIYVLRVFSHYQEWHTVIYKNIIENRRYFHQGNNVSLAYIDESMSFDVWKNSLDENNRKYVPDEVFESLQEASEIVDQIITNYISQEGPFVYAVIRNKDKANLGYVQLVKIEEGWEIGYHIAKIYTGKGYATEAVNLFLNYLRDKTDIKQVYGIALKTNKASKRVLEKTGFKTIYEGPGIYQGKRRQIIKTIKELK